MSLFSRSSLSRDEVNRDYGLIRDTNIRKGFQLAKEKGVNVPTEPFRIVEMVPLPGKVDGEHYWAVADYILAEYPSALGLQVASAFHNMTPQLGFDPFGKIMIGAQFVDRKAGSPNFMRYSFMRDHPVFAQYVNERDCPERTESSLDLLTAALFQFPSADHARKIFPTLLVVPEMKDGVKNKLVSIDEAIGRYITG